MGQKGCPETSLWNYHYRLHNKTEERISQPSRRYENNIKIDKKDTGREGMNWIALPQEWRTLV
jgi:hypothetical protein